MVGHIGVIVALVLLIVLALRGMNIFIASLLAAVVVAVTNAQPVAESLTADYSGALCLTCSIPLSDLCNVV